MWGDGAGGDGERDEREDDGGGGRDAGFGVAWWRFRTHLNSNNLRHFASFFYLFIKVFWGWKSLQFNDLRAVRRGGGGGVGF